MEDIDVCICTFRRASIVAAIETVAAQDLRHEVRLRIVVADNDDTPSAKNLVEAAAERLSVPLTYVHAPARNISLARNACLDAATAPWVAFIDDDEEAPPTWLRHLTAQHEQCDIIFGVSKGVITRPDAPKWLASGDFHTNRIAGNDGAHNGYTCNVLLRRSLVESAKLRFLPELGKTGGEDTIFFDDARRAGARFAFAPGAIVHEEIPDNRATLGWLLRRRFRSGQTHYFLQRRNGALNAAAIPIAAAKVIACGALAVVRAFDRAGFAQALLRGALHIGFISAALGKSTYQEYAQPAQKQD